MGILTFAAQFYAEMGRSDDAAAIARRAVVLDPLTARAHIRAARALILAHQYRDAIRELDRALSLDPRRSGPTSLRGEAYLGLGEFEHAREACMLPPVDSDNHVCLAIAYVKLHQLVAAKKELAAVEAELGDRGAYQYAAIDAQFGDIHKALEWIEKAYQLKESDLIALKVDPFLDPLRKEPRFQEIERKLNFPN
jgi:tetratricopeptide (TPR) repeat protein